MEIPKDIDKIIDESITLENGITLAKFLNSYQYKDAIIHIENVKGNKYIIYRYNAPSRTGLISAEIKVSRLEALKAVFTGKIFKDIILTIDLVNKKVDLSFKL